MKRVLLFLCVLCVLCGGAFAQTPPDCVVTTPEPAGVPASYDLVVGTHDFAADYDFAKTPACSATVTKSCIVAVKLQRDGAPLASCNVPATASGRVGLKFSVTLAAPLKQSDLVATVSYRDDAGALLETPELSNVVQVRLRPAGLEKLRKP